MVRPEQFTTRAASQILMKSWTILALLSTLMAPKAATFVPVVMMMMMRIGIMVKMRLFLTFLNHQVAFGEQQAGNLRNLRNLCISYMYMQYMTRQQVAAMLSVDLVSKWVARFLHFSTALLMPHGRFFPLFLLCQTPKLSKNALFSSFN